MGQEILKLAEVEADYEYLKAIAEDFVRKGFEVVLGEWEQSTPTSGNIINKINIELSA
ncbi:membrane-fusion protein [Aliivibrio fischeri MJ11]|uniref:Membrane-fusion protein n=1 Tax=Aliivibrio fischeri (strain MJ11) TaxID=388396 RepID=B5EU56_ALIFM|nr:hypothetical protein [Aliivibrio fischeri]ACH63397.1 membrane-fusion protein [Aliivibrio fischeri MJ11]